MRRTPTGRWDAVISVLLASFVFVLAVCSFTPGHSWGDDFAAYINEAIALVDGRMEEQFELNLLMHPTPPAG